MNFAAAASGQAKPDLPKLAPGATKETGSSWARNLLSSNAVMDFLIKQVAIGENNNKESGVLSMFQEGLLLFCEKLGSGSRGLAQDSMSLARETQVNMVRADPATGKPTVTAPYRPAILAAIPSAWMWTGYAAALNSWAAAQDPAADVTSNAYQTALALCADADAARSAYLLSRSNTILRVLNSILDPSYVAPLMAFVNTLPATTQVPAFEVFKKLADLVDRRDLLKSAQLVSSVMALSTQVHRVTDIDNIFNHLLENPHVFASTESIIFNNVVASYANTNPTSITAFTWRNKAAIEPFDFPEYVIAVREDEQLRDAQASQYDLRNDLNSARARRTRNGPPNAAAAPDAPRRTNNSTNTAAPPPRPSGPHKGWKMLNIFSTKLQDNVDTAVCSFCLIPSYYDKKTKTYHTWATCRKRLQGDPQAVPGGGAPNSRRTPAALAAGGAEIEMINETDDEYPRVSLSAITAPAITAKITNSVHKKTNTVPKATNSVHIAPASRGCEPSAAPTSILDSGAAPYHILNSSQTHGTPVRAFYKVTGPSNTSFTTSSRGTGAITTVSETGPCRLVLPGTSLFMPPNSHNTTSLISYSTLLDNDFEISLHKTGGTITTRDKHTILLERLNGLYVFPAPHFGDAPVATLVIDGPVQPLCHKNTTCGATLVKSAAANSCPETSAPAAAATTAIPASTTKTTTSAPARVSFGEPSSSKLSKALIDLPLIRRKQDTTMKKQAKDSLPVGVMTPEPESSAHLPVAPAAHDNPSLPTAPTRREHNFRLWTRLHVLRGHPGNKRLLLHARAMADNDPERPALSTFKLWVDSRKCDACEQGKPLHPSRKNLFPLRPPDQYLAGEMLHIDGLGDFPEDPPQADGTTSAIVFADRKTNYHCVFPVQDRTSTTMIALLNKYQAASGVRLRHVRADPEFDTNDLHAWAAANNTKFTFAAPREQHQNSLAELAVRATKETARTLRIASSIGLRYLSTAYVAAAAFHNRQPSYCDTDTANMRAPLTQWPEAPFSHPTLPLHPYGCACWPFVGKSTANPNVHSRAPSAIYLHHDPFACGHVVLLLDSMKIQTFGTVTAEPLNFPMRNMLLAGELDARQGLDPDGWRAVAPDSIDGVSDLALAEFATGKELVLKIPDALFPSKGTWLVKCVASTTTRGQKDLYGIKLLFDRFVGDINTLSLADRQVANKEKFSYIFAAVSTPAASDKCPASWTPGTTLRALIRSNFPEARTLADIATSNSMRHGAALPKSLRDSRDDAFDAVPARTSKQLQTSPTPLLPATVPPTDRRYNLRSKPTPATAPVASCATLPQASPAPTRPRPGIITAVRKVGSTRSAAAKWYRPKAPSTIPCRRHVSTAELLQRSAPRQATAPTAYALLPSKIGEPIGFTPKSAAEARRHPTWPLWHRSMIDEFENLVKRKSWERVPLSSVPPGTTILPTMWVYHDKSYGAKSRLCVRGDREFPAPSKALTFASTPTPTEVRTLLSVAAQNNYAVHKLDISQSFLQSHPLLPGSHYYIKPPPEANEPRDVVYRLLKPLYGIAVAPAAWSETLRAFILEQGLTPVNGSDTFFSKSNASGDDTLSVIWHVDDILVSFSKAASGLDFKSKLLSRFDGTDDGEVRSFLGCTITRTADHLHISQQEFAHTLLAEHNMLDCNPASTPLPANERLLRADRPEVPDAKRRHLYQSIVGSLQWLSTWTRPDLQHSSNALGAHNENPGPTHLQAAYRALRYLKGTLDLGITYSRGLDDPNRLLIFGDSDFASDTETRRSVYGWVSLLNGGAVSWRSRQAPRVATSTSESEYVASSRASDEAIWLRRTLADIFVPQRTATPLFCDNRACRMMSENPVYRERTKHIDIRAHALRERVRDDIVRVLDCPTHDMLADALTKQLPAPSHRRHSRVMLGLDKHTAPPPPAILPARTVTRALSPSHA